MFRNSLIDESRHLQWGGGIKLDEENKNEIVRGLELLQWFKGVVVPSPHNIFVQKASERYGIPLKNVSGEHTIVVEEELREILE